MWSKWRNAGSVAYWTDEGILFSDGDDVLDRTTDIVSQAYLVGVSNSLSRSVNRTGTKGLIFSNFGLAEGLIDQVEVRIRADRLARIVDDRVQLFMTAPLGNNVADLDSANDKTYSGPLKDYWGVRAVDPSLTAFGVLIDFAPRPDMPSSNPLIVRSVDIRVHYVD